MAVRVIVLAERSTEVLADWVIPTGSSVASPHWAEVTLKLVRRARIHGAGGGEVYACLIGDPMEGFDHRFLERLAHQAGRHAWGSKLFVVLDPRDRFAGQVEDLHDAVDEWYETAWRCGIRLAEAPCRMGPIMPLPPAARGILRDAGARAQRREVLYHRFDPNLTWSVALASIQSPVQQVQKLVRRYLIHEAVTPHNSNLLVVVKEKDGLQLAALTEALLGRLQGVPLERLLIGTVGVEAQGSLDYYCRSKALPLIHFPGTLELRSFIQWINAQTGQTSDARHKADDRSEAGLEVLLQRAHERFRTAILQGRLEDDQRIEAETLEWRLLENLAEAERFGRSEVNRTDRNRIVDSLNYLALRLRIPSFTSFLREEISPVLPGVTRCGTSPRPSPTLLVTHAFDPESDPERCLQAAAFVGSMLEEVAGLAPGANVRIHLAITRSGLQDMMSGMVKPTAWVFLGPAGGPEGLWDIKSGSCVTADQWEACFHGEGRRPALAILLGGRSEETARHFAASGVACAIGFSGEIPLESLTFPVREIFHHSLTSGVDCRQIESLLSVVTGAGEPKIFCSGHS
jgi:hypothetical protein